MLLSIARSSAVKVMSPIEVASPVKLNPPEENEVTVSKFVPSVMLIGPLMPPTGVATFAIWFCVPLSVADPKTFNPRFTTVSESDAGSVNDAPVSTTLAARIRPPSCRPSRSGP